MSQAQKGSTREPRCELPVWLLRPPGVWAGGHLGVETVLILGFSNIFADAFAMGMGEFLSSKAHNEYVLKERQREKW